jgi:tetratricopeptide (TPR) repeat protein
MSLAVTLVKERAGPVFFHRPGTRLTEGDIEFAAQCFPERKFFVVDNAVDEAEGILSAVRKLRDRTDTACFLTGSRLNEWRQAGPRLHPKEYEMSPLSDPEIERLLDCLGQHGALGRLEGLPRSAQEAAIKVRYKQDLLVAMKEATEGQSFNAIIEDEYRGMATDFGQQLYATVCGFYRLRAFARDSLLAHIMKRPYSDLFGHEADCTKGVIFWDDLDVARGIYGARARHHLISEIVWRRCLEGHQRQQIMLDAMSSLNLNYAADAQAFERFVRSDDTLEDIGTLEAKLDFFEMACKKDPRSPYVRQHFARMFRREGRFDLALDQIRHALGIDSDVLVLYHTQGTILADLAVTAASDELGRKWLAQSELSFRHILSRRPRDDYAFQGLADLYLRWAKRISSPDERADYLRRCEGVIAEGLKAVRSKESLWIISADVAGYVGDHPETVAALEKAVNESGSALTRYLLAREHYRAHKYRDALAVLEPLVGSGSEDARNEYRACLLYSQAQWKMRRPPADCIPALRVSELYGLRDAAFIATYAGLLFLSGEYTEADKLWRAARSDSNLSFQETTKVHLYPNVPAPRLEGTVGAVKPGYCFLRVPGLPDIMFPGSRYRGQAMKVGLKVSFEIGFAAGGPTVLDFAIAEASAH